MSLVLSKKCIELLESRNFLLAAGSIEILHIPNLSNCSAMLDFWTLLNKTLLTGMELRAMCNNNLRFQLCRGYMSFKGKSFIYESFEFKNLVYRSFRLMELLWRRQMLSERGYLWKWRYRSIVNRRVYYAQFMSSKED